MLKAISASIGRWLCQHNWHQWRKMFGERHWYVECQRCHTRDLWPNHGSASGYQPLNYSWLNQNIEDKATLPF